MKFRLVPVDEGFFALFTESALNAAEAARRLREFLSDPSDPEARCAAVVECERKGDAITRDLLHRLNSTFVTPFDREDIHALAEELDDVVDDIMEVAHRLGMGPLVGVPPELTEQADLLVRMADEAVELCNRLASMKGVAPHLENIDRLESEGDSVYRRSLARLFSGDYEALDVIRWKDTIEAMEAALNTVEDISDVVESIVLKHA